jgi:hypothetical protein
MSYLDLQRLEQIATQSDDFLNRKPFPWLGMNRVLHDDAFRRLCAGLPQRELFAPEFGRARGYGQQSHDRFALQYRPQLDAKLSPAWREFIAELHGDAYQSFLRRMYGLGPGERVVMSMHWHHAASGGSVSPHTDARRKVGSHIFYFNTADDWDTAWGGQTLVLDDGGKLSAHDAPAFGSLPQVAASEILDNRSFIFKRTEHSWHAVNPIECPPDRLRKVFIVVLNHVNLQVMWRRLRGKDPDGYRL